jgi:flagellar protein FlaJ
MTNLFKAEGGDSSKETKITYASLILGSILIIVGIGLFTISDRFGGFVLIFGLLLAVLPYGIVNYLKTKALENMEEEFPEFLRDLAESKRGGMTIMDSFDSAVDNDYGKLNPQIEKANYQMSWGIPFPEVINNMTERLKESTVIRESLSIILQGYKSGGQITDTIESVAQNARMLRDITQEKKSKLKQQLIIMYVIYFMFIGISVGIYVLLQTLLGLGSQEAGALENIGEFVGGGSVPNFCSGGVSFTGPFCSIAKIFGFIPAEITDLGSQAAEEMNYGKMAYYKSLLFSMLMIQGISTAAVAGQISDSSPSAGIKHAIIMIPVGFLIFMLVVRPMGF